MDLGRSLAVTALMGLLAGCGGPATRRREGAHDGSAGSEHDGKGRVRKPSRRRIVRSDGPSGDTESAMRPTLREGDKVAAAGGMRWDRKDRRLSRRASLRVQERGACRCPR